MDRDEIPPRMSVETDYGESIDVTDDPALDPVAQPLLPPVQFPSETLSESLNSVKPRARAYQLERVAHVQACELFDGAPKQA